MTRGSFESVQVNIDAEGRNIPGDAANEPSIAIDPCDPDRIVIGWRQFDTVNSDFRQAGWAYSHDGGKTWAFPGVLEEGVFRSDPVLDTDADGNFYFYSLTVDGVFNFFATDLFKSIDGGITWSNPWRVPGGDKPWMTIDKTGGIGRNNIYLTWGGLFSRSTNGGASFLESSVPDRPSWGTVAVGFDGAVYVAGGAGLHVPFSSSRSAQDAHAALRFELEKRVDLGGATSAFVWDGPNPGGLLGQMWVAADHSQGPRRGNVYLLGSVDPGTADPLDVMFARSTDGGSSWSQPIRVNDDPADSGAWQWFGTMAVAPSGRIDVVWNDTRNTGDYRRSELFYAFSGDGGVSWSENVAVSPVFDSYVGWPQQDKIGDYYHMISNNAGVNVAYAATFNGEQDIYFLRLVFDCNGNGIPDDKEFIEGHDCNGNAVLDNCDLTEGHSADEDRNGVPDECEAAVLFVDAEARGLNQGTSWANAYAELHAALRIASLPVTSVSEIWIANGTYTPTRPRGDRTATFRLADDVSIYGGFAGGETDRDQRNLAVHPTILSGDLNGDDRSGGSNAENSYTVVTWDESNLAGVLDGVTIAYGNADGSVASGPTGGGMSIHGTASLTNCYFRENSGGPGGGVYNDGTATLVNCTLSQNSARFGGGLYNSNMLTMVNCVFRANSAVDRGGGLRNGGVDSSAMLSNCTFWGNTARSFAGVDNGGARNTTILTNCVLWGNRDQNGESESAQISPTGTVRVQYSCIQGWSGALGGEGNFGEDPLFVDADGADDLPGTFDDDLRLSPASAAINSGDPAFMPDLDATDLDGRPRLQGCRMDRGAYESAVVQPKADFEPNGRVDLKDYAFFYECAVGHPTVSPTACTCAFDSNRDLEVDLFDFHTVQQLFKGK